MSFDEEPDDPHEECQLEIYHLRARVEMLDRHLKERERLLDEATAMLLKIQALAAEVNHV